MSEAELLGRLAAAHGLACEYHDIWNRRRQVSAETTRTLLRAMGLTCEDEDRLRNELAAHEERSWLRCLEPVEVVRQPYEAVPVTVTVPEEWLARIRVVRVETEQGRVSDQPFVPARLLPVGRRHVAGRDRIRCRLSLEIDPGPGYHRLSLEGLEGQPAPAMRLIVAPPRCHEPDALRGDGRVWGPAVQLYGLRSSRNWGIGDFHDLERLIGAAGELGAGILGLNPLHALYPQNPAHASPYSPSSRVFTNAIYLDIESIEDFAECEPVRQQVGTPEFQARLMTLREVDRVDYPAVARTKQSMLKLLYEHFRREHLERDTERARAFRAFQRAGGATLEAYGVFEALHERFVAEDPSIWGWPAWPEPFRRPDSPSVRDFASQNRERVEFHQYLQWQCELQFARCGRRCLELGLKVGLYQDLAVSVDRSGFETWSWQDVFAIGASLGAPPDDFNLQGQNWGLPPWIPERLREAAYQPFIQCLRANMRHAGALRIDHVMGLMRAFWVPNGRPATEGAYVHYPFQDLLGVLALESSRNRCLVIGEDLGTVPDEVREALAPNGILSYRLFYFMKDAQGDFLPPGDYPDRTLVAVTTHDLPTLAGFWSGRDISLRSELGLFPEDQPRDAQLLARTEDRTRLLFALRREGLLPEGVEVDLAKFPEMSQELVLAIHRFIACSPSKVLTFQLEDLLGQVDQVNLPGTMDEHPNWRRKLELDLERLVVDPRLGALAAALRRERGEGRVRSSHPDVQRPASSGRPQATYRVQLGPSMTFQRLRGLVPYLCRLGISHVYASPFLRARPGSLHGYDIIDHGSLNPEIGTSQELGRLVETLHANGMGLILDIVPNHMGVGSDNAWWMSVLEHGQASPWAESFDIEWQSHQEFLRRRVLLPLLEDHFGAVLEQGLLRLGFDARRGSFQISYHEHVFPIDPRTYSRVLGLGLERLGERAELGGTRLAEYQSLMAAFHSLPHRDELSPERRQARLRDASVLRHLLARLAGESHAIASVVAENVARFNGVVGEPASFDLLEDLLERQAYRLAYWRVASDEINYRRFFDVNNLAGLRMEHPPTFEATHHLVCDLVRRGWLDGLRIDHPDGLHDPAGYYRSLREKLAQAPGDADGRSGPRAYIVVEKILAAHERLPRSWAVDGTTGYDFCNEVGGLFVDPAGEKTLDRVYVRFVGRRTVFDEVLRDAKRLILASALSSELAVLSNDLERIAEADRHTRDFTRERLRQALAEVIANFPVYRTYVAGGELRDEDRKYVEWAVARARGSGRAWETGVFDFIRDVLLLESAGRREDSLRQRMLRFAMKFQQTTGPVMAKGCEDTAFYTFNRLLALNEVGGDPSRFGLSIGAFHQALRERSTSWPRTMLCTSTHDTKRSEDVRARLHALSEIPDRWQSALRRWTVLNRRKKTSVEGQLAPSRNDEYALYQTLLGIWPFAPPDDEARQVLRERVQAWASKAVREAKVHSSWINPNEAYEAAVRQFVDALLEPGEPNLFLSEFVELQRAVARLGLLNALSQLVIKLTAPGVPDIYQGNEIWTFNLVDPDSRRPVDFQLRERLLAELDAADPAAGAWAGDLLGTAGDGRIKLFVTSRLLRLRRKHPELFVGGRYEPLQADGDRADHLCTFARRNDAGVAITVAPRLWASLGDVDSQRWPMGPVWGETALILPAGAGPAFREVLTGANHVAGPEGRLPLAQLLAHFPVAVLVDSANDPA